MASNPGDAILSRAVPALVLALALPVAEESAFAATAPDGQASFSLFSPAPDDQLRPLCTDRPGKNTSPCTVDAGHIQIDVDAFDATFDRTGSLVTDTALYASPTVKLGLDETADIELTLTPYMTSRTHDRATGARSSVSGFGDLVLHGKFMLFGDGQPWAAALDPFLKIPTARTGLGNGAVEGGIVAPIGYALSDVWSLATTPEVDILEDASGQGYHAALTDVAGLSRTWNDVTLGAELWGNFDFDPSGTVSQYSFDLTAAWQPLGDFQIDGGVNFALNRNAPRTEIYLGVSDRI